MTPRVQRWLENGRSARILHLFEEVCNLVDDQGEVITLAAPAVSPGPFTLILDDGFTAHLDLQQPVHCDGAAQSLTIGAMHIDGRNAVIWQPRPSWSKLQQHAPSDFPPPRPLPADIETHLQQLLQGILHDDVTTCQEGAWGLAGRGAGLTPTGDDVLIGVLYGLWVWYSPHNKVALQQWTELIVATAVPRTTTLSGAFLRAAAAGEATYEWHDLVNGRSGAIQNILKIGHHSGADALTGFTRINQILMR